MFLFKYCTQFNPVCCMLLRQQGMQGHEIGATLLATFVSELKKSYTLCHFITKYFLLQTTLNSISKRFSKYQIRVYLFRIRRGTTLGPWDKLPFKKPCIMWTDFTNCACKKVKKKISDRFSILWKQPVLNIF